MMLTIFPRRARRTVHTREAREPARPVTHEADVGFGSSPAFDAAFAAYERSLGPDAE